VRQHHRTAAARLRAGNAGANTATDHIEVLAAAINQIPRAHRKHVLIRADGAGASHALLDWLTAHNEIRGRRVDYSVGFAVTDKVRQAIMVVSEKVWTPAIVRRERPHTGAQLSIFEERDGWRYQAFATNTAIGQLAFPPPRACPRRRPYPPRQGHRPGPIPVPRIRHQLRVAGRHRDRRRPDRLATAARTT
jgi:Transposase DDE domain group 1